jgi:hypothetical protein
MLRPKSVQRPSLHGTYVRIASAHKVKKSAGSVAPIGNPSGAAIRCDFHALHNKVGDELESWDV